MATYKVLSTSNKFFKGKFDTADIESMLNEYARDGWKVISITSAEKKQGMSGGLQELIIIMEKL